MKTPAHSTVGTRRTLDAFRTAMLDMLAVAPFEKITVSELCERARYPRATFYNYFDDKFDLVGHCWDWILANVRFDDVGDLDPEDALRVVFDHSFDFVARNRAQIRTIIAKNPRASYLVHHFESYLGKRMCETFGRCFAQHPSRIPEDVVSRHYENTVLLILDWALLGTERHTKAEARECLLTLLGPVAHAAQEPHAA